MIGSCIDALWLRSSGLKQVAGASFHQHQLLPYLVKPGRPRGASDRVARYNIIGYCKHYQGVEGNLFFFW